MSGMRETLKKTRRLIIDTCKKFELPLTVRSTAIRIFDKVILEMYRSDVNLEELGYFVVILGAKCEEIHGSLGKLIKRLPITNENDIFKYEDEVFQLLDFNFHYPCLYLRMYGIIAILQEKGLIRVEGDNININKVGNAERSKNVYLDKGDVCVIPCLNTFWDTSVATMDYLLEVDKSKYSDIDLIYGSLNIPQKYYDLLPFPYDKGNLLELSTILDIYPS